MSEEGRFMRSDEARDSFRALTDEVALDGAHVTILRYNTPVAVMVPVEWHEQAVAALVMEAAR
jgi:PHD/YefM family antitoxin component YafN of YafNO toxin-antitoxin module